MNNKKYRNRTAILSALAVNAFCCGGTYAWSVFASSLAEYRGWDYSQVTLAYSMMLLMLAIFGIPGGKILDKFGPRKMMLLASVMWGGGWFLTGCVTQLWQLYLVFGVMTALGSGFCYSPSITTAVRWYPDRSGFASGLIVGATGLSSLVIAPVANLLLEKYNVSIAFRLVGGGFFILMFLATLLFVDTPTPGWKPEGFTAQAKTAATGSNDKTWREMLKDKQFYMLWIAFLGGCVSGLMLISHAAAIGRLIAGISSAQAALLVGIMAVANFSGRTIMGTLSDKLGRYPTAMISLAVSAVDMVLMSMAKGFTLFVITLIVLCVCFGGLLAVFPGIVYDRFGLKNGGLNYGIVFTAYGIAAIIGPMSASKVVANYGTYNMAFLAAGMFAAVSFVVLLILYLASKKERHP